MPGPGSLPPPWRREGLGPGPQRGPAASPRPPLRPRPARRGWIPRKGRKCRRRQGRLGGATQTPARLGLRKWPQLCFVSNIDGTMEHVLGAGSLAHMRSHLPASLGQGLASCTPVPCPALSIHHYSSVPCGCLGVGAGTVTVGECALHAEVRDRALGTCVFICPSILVPKTAYH
nr:uncharacterized protein LOC123286442 isoform X1 [Equus asinus]